MQEFKKIHKWIEAINTYYAFAVLVYPVILFVANQIQLFIWIFAITTPLLAGWSGYLLKIYLDRRRLRHGFEIIADSMTYEIGQNHHYTLRYNTTAKARTTHLMTYPVGYQWSGSGEEAVPKLAGSGQELLGIVQKRKSYHLRPVPYQSSGTSTEGDWHYWFIAFNPPVHTGDEIQIKYSQEFYDKQGTAQPYLYYFVRTAMKRLELHVRFPQNANEKIVTSSYIKPSDPHRPYAMPGVVYDADRQWASWIIEKPKIGYCYRIHWQ